MCGAWWLVYTAKVPPRRRLPRRTVESRREIDRAEKLYPVLAVFQSPGDREFVARRIFECWPIAMASLPNTAAIARIRVPRAELVANQQLEEFASALKTRKDDTVACSSLPPSSRRSNRRSRCARSACFRRDFLLWAGAILGAFLLTHIVWTVRGFTGPVGVSAAAPDPDGHRVMR